MDAAWRVARGGASQEELTISYLGSVGSEPMARATEERRASLRRKHKFHCGCARCGPVSAADRLRYERMEARATAEDERVCADVAAFNAS